jgi:predicted porin
MMFSKKLLAAVFAVTLPLSALAQVPPPSEPAPPPTRPPSEPARPPPPAKPAEAKPPLVQVYGTVNLNLQNTAASGASPTTTVTTGTGASGVDVSRRLAISTDSSHVGVRGTLELIQDLSGVYQCETSANIDGEAVSGLCNRNSRVGLSGSWGTLAFGTWDTPFKGGHYGTKADDPFGNTDVFGYQGLMGSPGYGVRTGTFTGGLQAGFDLRATNSVIYWSPKISGLSARVQYSVDELRNAVGLVDPMLLSAVINFDTGGLSLVAAADYHEDAFGIRTINNANSGSNNSAAKDLGWRLVAGYELPLGVGALTVMGMFEQLAYGQENATAGFKDYRRLAWLLGARFRTGDHEFRARYSQALDPNITAASGTTLAPGAEDDLGAQQYAVGYAYHLAKSAQVFAFFTQIINQDRAQYSFGVAGAANVTGTNVPVGSDPLAVGLGIRLAF